MPHVNVGMYQRTTRALHIRDIIVTLNCVLTRKILFTSLSFMVEIFRPNAPPNCNTIKGSVGARYMK